MGRVREVFAAMGREMRKNKGSFAVYVVLRLIVLACAVGSLAFDNYEAFFLCLLTLVLFLVPTFIEVNFSISITGISLQPHSLSGTFAGSRTPGSPMRGIAAGLPPVRNCTSP